MTHRIALAALPFLTLTAPAIAQTSCADMAGAAPEGVEITEATETAATDEIPVDHCLIRGTMAERTGADGRPYALRFELRLPDDWSGRFMHQFNGGNDGKVVPALGAGAGVPTNDSALQRGFAVVSSDAGHDGEANPEAGLAGSNAFGLEFEARRMYGYGAVAALHPVALTLTEAHYGRAPDYVYGYGRSNGGRHGMVAASRMPDAFDGILAGYPGFNLPRASLQHAWDVQTFLSVGETLPEAFSRDEMRIVADGIVAACDDLDGLEDGIVSAPMQCQTVFDPAALICDGNSRDDSVSCLPEEKIAALQRIHAGPTNAAGDVLYSDWPWDTGLASEDWRFWKLESHIPPWDHQPLIAVMGAGSLSQVFTTPPTEMAGDPEALQQFLVEFDFDTDAPKIDATSEAFPESAMEIMTPPGSDDPKLAEFQAADGRMIIFHGTSDPVFSFNDTVDWVERLGENVPEADSFVRFYPVPGMPHGQGGASADEFDLLAALTDWVEDDVAPDRVTATIRDDNEAAPEAVRGTTRPLCPYPAEPKYQGGDTVTADNFACE
ncbi:tannase/feruloyl esterase family alpha/beta hydrolase [Mesobaculum littorinae]|uniref:Tannase/feruloyl esterase family alpha/beta hydrolase n=1 Tax=Mesobaculum littorinae TaxID=2486419 RepID=A0A438AEU2_9RHOB|nr:tannase/feruloyl esterase family alpha/beta hydrolase [Mesobaculum littorinae]RVV97220.1 tannase/feruloyl esterase family alpha/beta hydrolase [Mesobaculum littorinae]